MKGPRTISAFLYFFCISSVLGQCLPTSMEQYISKLEFLLERDLNPQGYPFPKIKGPKQNDKICIIGGGPAGIHMALSLKRKGYPGITIFEKTNRVGGKSYDSDIDGIYRPQGTIFLTAEYLDNIVKLGKEYGVGEIHRLPAPGVRLISSTTYKKSSHVKIKFWQLDTKC